MKKFKIIIIFAIIAVLSLNCSKDLLEKSDPGSGSVETFFNNEEELILGINGVYNAFQGDWWGGSLIYIQPHFDGATDNATICCPWEYWGWGLDGLEELMRSRRATVAMPPE